MKLGNARGWRRTVLSPRSKTAMTGVLVGAGLSLVLIATPLWVLGGRSSEQRTVGAPLAALATLPAEPAEFDISNILVGEWAGEVCPDEGEPVAVHFQFRHDSDDAIVYSLSVDGETPPGRVLGNGACDVDGENISFHAFLAILSECDEACGVDRFYEGHFDEGALVGSYQDDVVDEVCLSCVGGGSWWIKPEA